MQSKLLHLLGYAYGGAGADIKTGEGPTYLHASSLLKDADIAHQWDCLLQQATDATPKDTVIKLCTELSVQVEKNLAASQLAAVIGGDHTSAIGTWNGAQTFLKMEYSDANLGLIWIDAHMDSHSPATSESGRLHGMPLAVLLGNGYKELVELTQEKPIVRPENLCIIGVRSFEAGEANYLKQANVRIFYMDEVITRGLAAVMEDARQHVTQHAQAFGISLDIDSIDPEDAPAVAVPEKNGIRADSLLEALPLLLKDPRYLMTEIVEFNPSKDIDRKTEKLLIEILRMLSKFST